MIGYLKGNIVFSTSNLVILDVDGIGYEVYFFNKYSASEYGNNLTLFVVQKVSDYGETLYGFATIDEKLIFESLDNIKGIGSKSIFTIMSALNIKSISDLHSIKLDDLVGLPGIGKSTAQKFLLGLSAKLKKEFDLEEINNTVDVKKVGVEKQFENEISLLVDWGIRKSDVISIIESSLPDMNGKRSEDIIKFVLKSINK